MLSFPTSVCMTWDVTHTSYAYPIGNNDNNVECLTAAYQADPTFIKSSVVRAGAANPKCWPVSTQSY